MDLAARDRLIENHLNLIGFFAKKFSRCYADRLDWDDIYSAANLGLVTAAEIYDPTRGAFSTLVGVCTRNICVKALRTKRKEPPVVSLNAPISDDPESNTLADLVPDSRSEFENAIADRDRLDRFFAQLSLDERRLLFEYANGATQKQLGQRLGISQVQVSRILKAIRRKERSMTELRILDREEFVERVTSDLARKQNGKRRKPMEHKASPTLAERADLYNKLRAEGANPDEAAQGAGYKSFISAQTSLKQAGIKISAKLPPSSAAIPPDEAEPVMVIDKATPAPEPDRPAVDLMSIVVDPPAPTIALAIAPAKTALLRASSWYGRICSYVDTGDYIEIKPLNGGELQLTRVGMQQFSEELRELLEIIK